MTKETALYWLNKAENSLEDSKILLEAGRASVEGACNRAAAAVFQMARALLVERDPDFRKFANETNAEIAVLFANAFIKTKKCDLNTYHGIKRAEHFIKESEQGLDRLFTRRDADEMIAVGERLRDFTKEQLIPEPGPTLK